MIKGVFISNDSTDETIHFHVRSSTRNTWHDVYFDIDNGFVCTCEQYYYRKLSCKHIWKVKAFMNELNSLIQNGLTYEEVRA